MSIPFASWEYSNDRIKKVNVETNSSRRDEILGVELEFSSRLSFFFFLLCAFSLSFGAENVKFRILSV